jgi:transcriptional regulator with XRE-family HTH domain
VAQQPKDLTPLASIEHFLGAELRNWRTLRGLSQRELGSRIHVHADTIAKAEKAERTATHQLLRACDRVLETGGALVRLLALAEHGRAHTASDTEAPRSPDILSGISGGDRQAMLRRTALEGIAGLVAAGVLWSAHPRSESTKVGAIDPELVDGIKRTSATYREAYAGITSSRLLPAARAHLDVALSLRSAKLTERQHRTLAETAAEMATLIGVLLAVDMARDRLANDYFDLSWRIAREFDDHEMQAVVLGCRSFGAALGGDDHRRGLAFADLARETASLGPTSRRTRGWVAAVASERCASLGDHSGFRTRLDEAAEALSADDADEITPRGIGAFHAGKLTAYEGGSLVRLGRYREAEQVLDSAIFALDTAQPRHLATAYIDRADARLQARDFDGACGDASIALTLVRQVEHSRNLDRIESVAARAEQSGIQQARVLRHEVRMIHVDHLGLETEI